MKIKQVDAKLIRPLRHMVLRTGKPFSTTAYKKDYHENTFHLIYVKLNNIIVCTTFYPEDTTQVESNIAYRLRGMATHPKERRKGFGKEVMLEAFKILHSKGCDLLWCNARIIALDFYKSLGFKTKGEIFNIGDIGAHYYMYRRITSSDHL